MKKKKLYYARTICGDIVISVDEENMVRYIPDNDKYPFPCLTGANMEAQENIAKAFLEKIDDDSSWYVFCEYESEESEEFEGNVGNRVDMDSAVTEPPIILAEIEKELWF